MTLLSKDSEMVQNRYLSFRKYDIMSTKEKQATPKAAFVFLVPLAKEQPAKQAGKRVSAGS